VEARLGFRPLDLPWMPQGVSFGKGRYSCKRSSTLQTIGPHPQSRILVCAMRKRFEPVPLFLVSINGCLGRPSQMDSGHPDVLRFRGCEVIDSALYPIPRAVAAHRVNRVVIGYSRVQALHPHAENRVRMVPV